MIVDNNNNKEQSLEYLQSLQAVRIESNLVYERVNTSKYYSVDESKLRLVAEFIQTLIAKDYNSDTKTIKPHARLRHIPALFLDHVTDREALLDMLVVSVLLDAGAGTRWKFDHEDVKYSRSEGIAVAVAVAFGKGFFSTDKKSQRVEADRLLELKLKDMQEIFQVAEDNPMEGLEGRLELLHRLGTQLRSNKVFSQTKRPSGLAHFIKTHSGDSEKCILDVEWFWTNVIIGGFNQVWPETRAKLNGTSLGDVHFCELTGRLVPFHKLSQWLCYSLLEPLEHVFGFQIENQRLLTGLPEYRNGGLLVDFDVIKPKFETSKAFKPGSQEIIEWRALTIVLLDKLHFEYFPNLTLAQMLEAGTWKAGRLIASSKRPDGRPPIQIISDGTVF